MDVLWLSFRAKNVWARFLTQYVYRSQFAAIGKRSIIIKPILIRNARAISLGADCGIRNNARIEVLHPSHDGLPRLIMGDGTTIEQDVHIICGNKIRIGNRVTIAPRVTILDTVHSHDDPSDNSGIGSRTPSQNLTVEIGDQAFLGVGVVVMPGVQIGKFCIIGANSVVTKSLPDYCVCAGSPAQVIKRYDFEIKAWLKEKTEKD